MSARITERVTKNYALSVVRSYTQRDRARNARGGAAPRPSVRLYASGEVRERVDHIAGPSRPAARAAPPAASPRGGRLAPPAGLAAASPASAHSVPSGQPCTCEPKSCTWVPKPEGCSGPDLRSDTGQADAREQPEACGRPEQLRSGGGHAQRCGGRGCRRRWGRRCRLRCRRHGRR